MSQVSRLRNGEKVKEYTNSQIALVIDEYIHKKIHRDLLKKRYIDGLTFDELAEKFDLSVRQTKNIVYTNEKVIFSHI